MNREIKFRAWDAQLCEMYTPEFPYIGAGSSARDIAIMINGAVITPSSYDLDVFSALKPPVPELILMQFTGLKDKNGVDVYESDVVEFTASDTGNKRKYKVEYVDGCFAPFLHHMPQYLEVIGNIYQNPELLNL